MVEKLTLNFNHDTVDHIMDNYSLRPGGTMGMEVTRRQYSARAVADLYFSPRTTGALGVDLSHAEHTFARANKGRNRAARRTRT